jgi:hypothetical protein
MTDQSIELTRGVARTLYPRLSCRASLPLAVLLAACFILLIIGQPSVGAQINYGTHMGTHVTYVNVTEDSGDDEPLPFFGAPHVTGNSIDFNPVGFDASSSNGDSDITDSNLVFMVTSKSGSRIRSLTLSEAGDTTLAGSVPPSSMGTATAVFATGVLDIQEVDVDGDNVFDPVGINHISVPFSLTFTPSGGTYFLGTDGGGVPIFHTPWSGSVTLDIDAILFANGFILPPGPIDPEGGATKISIDLDNTLVAVSQDGTSSVIAKKDFGGITIRTIVCTEPGGDCYCPEPPTFELLAFAAAGLPCRRRAMTRRQTPAATSLARERLIVPHSH